jgi:hypothetical protein
LGSSLVQYFKEQGFLVYAQKHYKPRNGNNKLAEYKSNFISLNSIERLLNVKQIGYNIKKSLKDVLENTSYEQVKFEKLEVRESEEHKVKFYVPESKKDEKLYSLDYFLESISFQGKKLPRTKHDEFILKIWNEFFINPFVDINGTYCYSFSDMKQIMELLGLEDWTDGKIYMSSVPCETAKGF